ncbi:unnamed protein product [Adineta steineri]|uniref:Uncharacterized protein n=1 Tax=Adineta steineri TaxID=433720 RepID=A0A814AIZ9_9BILA|nr:unnamed protein product [Adineta steineri]CAF1523246.1 unnamed protein product [Adineta steineri]
MISRFGMVAAELVLERVKELNLFKEITEIYILVPALLDLKGYLEKTLASRLSYNIGNIILTQLQAIIVDFLATLASLTMEWISQGHFTLRYTLVLFINISHFLGKLEGKTSYLQTPCFANLRGCHDLFLATRCIKLVVYSPVESNSIQYKYRTCSRDESNDNRITRTSHRSFIKPDWINLYRRLRGCLHICDKDACNQVFNF